MDIERATPLLGGLSPRLFMRRHWQKKPLLVRGAIDPAAHAIDRDRLMELAAADAVRSRVIVQGESGWTLRHGPLKRRALPPLKHPRWTLLVQGVDQHDDAAHELLARFRFLPQARLDDVMVSWASDGGGVGPHVDSYDVVLVQLQGRRRWRIGRLDAPELQPGVPLKILTNFVAEQDWLLEPGDLLYLPPGWAHEGVAEGECTTASVGFRAPRRAALGREVLQRMGDAAADEEEAEDGDGAGDDSPVYRDPAQPATDRPGRIPEALEAFAGGAMRALLADPRGLACALGEVLSEPERDAEFEPGEDLPPGCGVELDRCTRMLYDRWHVFINGESFVAGGADATAMRRLADRTVLPARAIARLSAPARELLLDWLAAGWLRPMAA
jgi:50S ribosomal protein L16 3-hydroxylase